MYFGDPIKFTAPMRTRNMDAVFGILKLDMSKVVIHASVVNNKIALIDVRDAIPPIKIHGMRNTKNTIRKRIGFD
jgi:hypothetical protein